MTTIYQTLGAHLALLRGRAGLSQKEAARIAGLNLRTLKGLELGQYANTRVQTLVQLADAYHVTLAAIFEPWKSGTLAAAPDVLHKKLDDLLNDPALADSTRLLITTLHKTCKKTVRQGK